VDSNSIAYHIDQMIEEAKKEQRTLTHAEFVKMAAKEMKNFMAKMPATAIMLPILVEFTADLAVSIFKGDKDEDI